MPKFSSVEVREFLPSLSLANNYCNLNTFENYNFAIARVRLRGSQGVAAEAQNVKIFFRLWITQIIDTD